MTTMSAEHEPVPSYTDHDNPNPREIGRYALVLPDPMYDVLGQTSEQLEREESNRWHLAENIRAIVEPYEGLYADKIPPASSNKRKLIGKKVKEGIFTAEPWEDHKELKGYSTTFRTTLKYKTGENRNVLNQAAIRIKLAGSADPKVYDLLERADPCPTLKLDYSRYGGLESLTLTSVFENEMYRCLFSQAAHSELRPVGGFIEKTTSIATNPIHRVLGSGVDVHVGLVEDTPSIAVGWRSPEDPADSDPRPLLEYRYDADKNTFRLHDSREAHAPQQVSVDDYLELVQGMMSIVPTTKISLNT